MTQERPLPNTYWVIPNRILAGEHPGDADADTAQTRLARLQAGGMQRFLDLTEEGEMPPYQHLLVPPSDYSRSPIIDCSVPHNVSQTRAALQIMHTALAQERGLYVHCRAGIGRTGLIVGCFLAEQQSSGVRALKHLNLLWRQSERAADWPKVPQTAEQASYVRHWPRLSQGASKGLREPGSA